MGMGFFGIGSFTIICKTMSDHVLGLLLRENLLSLVPSGRPGNGLCLDDVGHTNPYFFLPLVVTAALSISSTEPVP